MAILILKALVDIPLPAYLFISSCFIYLFGNIVVNHLHAVFSSRADQKATGPISSKLDLAERGNLQRDESLSYEEVFQLEKRAFFSRTWLFVCHQSRFLKIGDYHTFDIAGISFFAVLGKDSRIRAFHNVCRHRAYTVVRKSCGNSTRFSCKYHGWQYDDEGSLVKAPKFDESPGFNDEENGLFEVKLILTREGLIFVNFDASTMKLPFNDVKSHINLGNSVWIESFETTSAANWKDIANEFSKQAHSSQSKFPWLRGLRKIKQHELLGPLSTIKELSDGLWCTITLLPRSFSEVMIRCDLYGKEGHKIPEYAVEKCKNGLRTEMSTFASREVSNDMPRSYFSYKCGGRTIDLFAILSQHQRSERLSKKRLQPAIRVTGAGFIDTEAADLCDVLDGAVAPPTLEQCSKVSSWRRTVDW
ncbi:hypothetical protein LTR84_003062 [Exophiala bonariae]|uniref:Rieske domain-containing protein n=1 Tax=Exophiala bonariae TaxID=1690606 RepID=A0AAV9NBE3_9EURO|nr:hypothetical protein LTR84_003062 [Exophiala bonariae]